MKTVEYVKLKSDTNYIHVKYAVMEVTVGTSLATSQIWLKCISYGWDTKENLEGLKLTSEGYQATLVDGRPFKQDPYTGVDKTGIQGTIGEYSVVTLADVDPYNRGGKLNFVPNFNIG